MSFGDLHHRTPIYIKLAQGRSNKSTWHEARDSYKVRGEGSRNGSSRQIWYYKYRAILFKLQPRQVIIPENHLPRLSFHVLCSGTSNAWAGK